MNYTRKDLEEIVKACIKEYPTGFRLASEVKEKRIKNALKAYAHGVRESEVVALLDTTILGSAKDGFLITETTLYSSRQKNPVPFSDMVKATQRAHDIILTHADGSQDVIAASAWDKSVYALFEALARRFGADPAAGKKEKEPTITLHLEGIGEQEFRVLDRVEYGRKLYVVALSVGNTDGKVIIIESRRQNNGGETFYSVTDDAILETVYTMFQKRNKDRFNFISTETKQEPKPAPKSEPKPAPKETKQNTPKKPAETKAETKKETTGRKTETQMKHWSVWTTYLYNDGELCYFADDLYEEYGIPISHIQYDVEELEYNERYSLRFVDGEVVQITGQDFLEIDVVPD